MKKVFFSITLFSLVNISNAQNTFPSSGNVGIGTTTPGKQLEVNGILRVSSSASSQNYLQIGAYNVTNDNFGYVSSAGQSNGTGLKFETTNGPSSPGGVTRMTILNNGNIGIGTDNPGTFKLAVEGKIGAREVQVTLAAWADHVFNKNYVRMSLAQLDAYIKANNHLPNIPSEAEVKEKGIALGEMNAKLLEKIEELTLYIIELKKEINQIKKENQEITGNK